MSHQHYLRITMLLLLFVVQGKRPAFCDAHAHVDLLIQQLRSSSRTQRIVAHRELIELGEEILPNLKNARISDSALNFHLQQLEDEIRLRVALRTLNGTPVTLQHQDPIELEQLTKSLARQSKMSVDVDPQLRMLRVQVALKEQPFWKAIDVLSQNGDVGWKHNETGVAYSVQALKKHGATDYPKCLRVAAVHHVPRQNFRRRSRKGLVRIGLRIDVEPAVVPYFLTVRDSSFELRGNNNQMFSPFNPDAVREIPMVAQPWFEFTVDFQSSPDVPADEFIIDGEVELFCAARTTQIEVPLNAEKQADARVQFVSQRSLETDLKVVADVVLPEGSEHFDSHRLALLHRDAWLLEEGQRILPQQMRLMVVDRRRHRVEFSFRKLKVKPDETQFFYNYPDLFTSLPVSFKIQGIESSTKNKNAK